MENIITKFCPSSELRYALMGLGFEPYIIIRIERMYRSNDYILTLKLDE